MSSSERVLQIPELLENILTYLNPRDLLLSQRVSRLWAATINTSRPLQRTLFFLPDWSTSAPLSSLTSPLSPITTRTAAATNWQPVHNALLARAFPCNYPALQSSSHRHGLSVDLPATCAPSSHASARHPRASWRRMLLCQPPCTRLRLVRAAPWRVGRTAAVEEEGGITMGLLCEAAARGSQVWDGEFVSSDGSWHFEGIVGGRR
ncbi:MAG: hypothetical protein M1822_006972 [Bathelium mastoideum]|nr:MAG: hypothetical protein M1822_006972 [Bathelium mastoideum]